jgi:predicted unusual protein kinase regulating ubiquinone biosynthesis (AarF/ABC1/UbiB family)
VLGGLRGLAAKVGQMASYVDGMVPDEHRDAYETALGALRAAAPHSDPATVRRAVETELGAPLSSLFAEWDDTPFASASIGQVHRARLEDGREVAVKVQHPGIDKAVENDLLNASVLEGLVGKLGPRGMNSKAVFDEIATRFREELDYELEADRQDAFRWMNEGDPHIRVPAIVRHRSSRRVLTSELARGGSLEDLASLPDDRRRHYAEVLWRFIFRGNLVHGRFNADPHPGNYLFADDGTVTFLDFGCVQPISERDLALARNLHAAACAKDEPGFRANVKILLGTRPGVYEDAVVAYSRACFEPLFGSPFHMSREYVSSVVRGVSDLKEHVWTKDGSFTPLPPGMALMNRLQFGFYSVLARLDVEVDYAAIERELLREAGHAPIGPVTPSALSS